MPTLIEDLEFIDRVNLLRMQYRQTTGKFPTRLVLTDADVEEFVLWLDESDETATYIAEPYTCEPQLCGMSLRVERYAKQMRVYFQES